MFGCLENVGKQKKKRSRRSKLLALKILINKGGNWDQIENLVEESSGNLIST